MLRAWTNLIFLQIKMLNVFNKFNDYLLFNGLNISPVRHSKTGENEIIMKEVQNRDWQYVVESEKQLVENNKSHLKPLPKSEKKIIKSMKHDYRIVPWVYASTFRNIAEQFKIYLNSLPPDKKNEIERDYQKNRNGLLSVQDTESTVELFDSFAI